MPTVMLSAKVYNNHQAKLADKFLKSMLRGLKVQTKICGVSSHGWIQIEVSGEDEKVALHYLAEEIGLCPTLLEEAEKFYTVKGYVAGFNEKELHVDICTFPPSPIDAVISLKHLQAQLVDGRKIKLDRIVELFGIVKNVPLWVKLRDVSKEKSRVEAEFSERQLALYRSWTKSLLDRLIVLGASFNKVRLALKQARCTRDVVSIERLGLFEHAVACKLGTDAAGLIPKIGKRMWEARFGVFDPKEITEFLGCY